MMKQHKIKEMALNVSKQENTYLAQKKAIIRDEDSQEKK